MSKDTNKKIMWYNLAFMAFSAVWGFGNIINGFSEYGGLKVIISWILIFAIYFVPYTLMVGELGSSFKDAGGGVSSWIMNTIGPKMAYFAGWTYWIVHMPYISQKPNGTVIAASWVIFQNNTASHVNPITIQIICFIIFLFAMVISYRGLSILKTISTIAGSAMFIMSLLYILLMLAAPAITDAKLIDIDWSVKTFLPTFDLKFFTGLSILVFSVGGCEKLSPYVNKTNDPSKDFSKGMITLAIMVAVCAILGTISMGMMFDSNNIPNDLMTNGAYYAFQKLGDYYKVGNLFVIIYAIVQLITQFSVMVLSIDAPLRMLLDNADATYIPKVFFKQNKHGAYVNGHILILVIVSILIIIPAFGISNVDELVKWLVKVNSVCMPLRYLWVFVAYIALKKSDGKFATKYKFVKSKNIGILIGIWCFIFTAIACICGIYSDDTFQLVLNILTPFILVGLGIVFPYIAKLQKN